MATRQRMTKPDFWIDEKLGLMPEETQLLYIGLWGIADDEGRMQYSLVRFAAMLQPYKRLTEVDMQKRIEPLLKSSRVVIYKVGEEVYAWIPNFLKHQTIQHATASKLPPYDEASRILMNPHETYDPIEPNVIQPNPIECNTKNEPPAGKGKSECYTAEFELFWAEYPKKLEKPGAFRCWNTRLKESFDPKDMIAAARNYARATNGSKYIKHPTTFLGPDKPFIDYITGIPGGNTNGTHQQEPTTVKRTSGGWSGRLATVKVDTDAGNGAGVDVPNATEAKRTMPVLPECN